MFGRSKIKALEAEIEGLKSDVSQAEAAADRLTGDLRAERVSHGQTASLLADKCREARQLGKALNEALTERDALRDAAQARRAKQLANLRNQKPKQQAAH